MAINNLNGISSINNISSTVSTERKFVDTTSEATMTTEINTNLAATYIPQSKEEDKLNDENNSKENQENHLKSIMSVANQKMKVANTRCEFEYHEKTKRVSIKVIDRSTDEIVREIPPEDAIQMVEKMLELAGLIVDERR